MIKHIESVSCKGTGTLNEDMLVKNDETRIYAVIDGVTSLPGSKLIDGMTSGLASATHLAEYFMQCNSATSLSETVLEANNDLWNKMDEFGVNLSDKGTLWSAAFVAIRIHEFYVEYVQAGDCMLFAKYDDGTIRMLTRDQVAKFDQVSISKRLDGIQKELNTYQLWTFVAPLLSLQWSLVNTVDGYGIFNGEPELSQFLESGRINRAGLKRLYLLSDGLFYPSDNVGHADWHKTIHLIDELGLEAYTEYLIDVENGDLNCTRFPRHKVSDDKTGVIIHL